MAIVGLYIRKRWPEPLPRVTASLIWGLHSTAMQIARATDYLRGQPFIRRDGVVIFRSELTDASGQTILTLVLDALIHARPGS